MEEVLGNEIEIRGHPVNIGRYRPQSALLGGLTRGRAGQEPARWECSGIASLFRLPGLRANSNHQAWDRIQIVVKRQPLQLRVAYMEKRT